MHAAPMVRRAIILCLCNIIGVEGCAQQHTVPVARQSASAPWTFAVSGDSRNCGNVVMPAIAADARRHDAAFYWHLGDLRAIYKIDEDYAVERRFKSFSPAPSLNDYLFSAWQDFAQHQIAPFGSMPFFIGIGNHETIPPKTRNQFLMEFADQLDRPELREQRVRDTTRLPGLEHTAGPETYYHWIERGVDFINLDNATNDAFDNAQLGWLDGVLAADVNDPAIRTLIVGMHEALPHSLSNSHSMCGSVSGRESGERVYLQLADAQRRGKHVYVLASHSHYYLANTFDTPHWRDPANGGVVLPGWVVGTAGAERYALPEGVMQGSDAREHTYGYLLATVSKAGDVHFEFRALSEGDLQAARSSDYTEEFVSFCVAQNPEPQKLAAKRSDPMRCEDAAR
jgi:hypothetical protein